MAAQSNDWCRVLGIETPRLEDVVGHAEAGPFSMMLVALLERGQAMTLDEVAGRFEKAGVAERGEALRSLKRCRPGRPPVYRDGESYALDPHDMELDLWVFRLGLREPTVKRREPAEEQPPLPGPEVALSAAELDEAWAGGFLRHSWSQQRLVIAVLDAHGGGPMRPAAVVAELERRAIEHPLAVDSQAFRRKNSAVVVLGDGRWGIAEGSEAVVEAVRQQVRARVETVRRNPSLRSGPEDWAETFAIWEREQAERGAELMKLRRMLLVAVPARAPKAAALVDVNAHVIETFVGDELGALADRLKDAEVIGAVNVRRLLRILGIDVGVRRLADLRPPQKTLAVAPTGPPTPLTLELLVRSSCGIRRRVGDERAMVKLLAGGKGHEAKLRKHLRGEAEALAALYAYGRLHGGLRVIARGWETRLRVPWVHEDEPRLYDLLSIAYELDAEIEVVVGAAPPWDDPWAGAITARMVPGDFEGDEWLADPDGEPVDLDSVQNVRLLARVLH